jgi:ribonuclease Y
MKLRDAAEGERAEAARRQADAEAAAARAEQARLRVEQQAEADAARQEAAAAKLDRRAGDLEHRQAELDRRTAALTNREAAAKDAEKELTLLRREYEADRDEARRLLREVSGLSEEQAKEHYLQRVSEDVAGEAGEIIRKSVEAAEDEARERSRVIVLEAIQRYCASQTAEHTVAQIELADDAMKGRVIGREGRNIRSFEKATGVDVIIDDTPGVVGLSCFDPVRREVARDSLAKLVADGRIHPGRIEEVVATATEEMNERVIELGKQAGHDAHLPDLPRTVLPMLGRLHYRTSYGQNVLKHSMEVAHLAQVMADELGLDGTLARRAGLLHDIGKASDHEHDGGHPAVGAALLKKAGEPEAVVNAAAAHHGDVPATTPYTPLIMAADAISASRPGARRESLERYVKRLRELEDLATDFKGVRQAYAIHAGREIRVIADAKMLDDRASAKLARDIVGRIQDKLSFPGEIRVTVLRETRTVEFAR